MALLRQNEAEERRPLSTLEADIGPLLRPVPFMRSRQSADEIHNKHRGAGTSARTNCPP